MQRGELYLASFPFGDVPGMKLRPVLLLSSPIGPVPEILVAYISSVVPLVLLPSDILLDPSQPGMQTLNLKVQSVLRLHKLATIHTTSVQRYLGKLAPVTEQDVSAKLKAMLAL
jgi:mRNA interferase MazF